MTINRQKKNVKQRGSKTHGYGSMKKHRGAGSRGGRGNAGSGKRGDVKKPSFLHQGRVMGRHGFSSPVTNKKVNTINLSLITQRINSYVESKEATKSKDGIKLDLTKMGYDKLLGTGIVTEKLNVTVLMASSRAVEKIESLGGKVTLLYAEDVKETVSEKPKAAESAK